MDAALLHDNRPTTRQALRRLFDAAPLNAIANDPHVRPTCGGDGKSYLDFSAFLADPRNHALAWDDGAFMFQWTGPQTFEGHVMVLREGRGRVAYARLVEALAVMAEHGAERIWARVAEGMDALRHYVVAAGFTRCGSDTLDIGFGPVLYDLYQWKKPCLQQ